MAKQVKKEFKGSFVTVRMCRIDLSSATPEQIKELQKHRPELLEDVKPKSKSKSAGDN